MTSLRPERFANVKAIYFDLDDTLCGYWDAAKGGLRVAFEKHPVPGHTLDESLAAWAEVFRQFSPTLKQKTKLYGEYLTSGTTTRTHQMQRTLLHLGVDDHELAHNLSFAYMVARDQNLKLFPEVLPVIKKLHKTYPLGLITNGPADIQNQEVDTLSIRKYLSHIFIEGELRIGKPHDIVFDKAREAMNLEPEQILMVGNSFGHDILPAVKHGWVAAWIRRDTDVAMGSKTGLPDPIPTSGPMPDAIIDSIDQLLPLLGV